MQDSDDLLIACVCENRRPADCALPDSERGVEGQLQVIDWKGDEWARPDGENRWQTDIRGSGALCAVYTDLERRAIHPAECAGPV